MPSCVDEPSYRQDGSLWRQLLIIGNGFDKECGLRSGFGDFFESRREQLKLLDNPSIKLEKNGYAK